MMGRALCAGAVGGRAPCAVTRKSLALISALAVCFFGSHARAQSLPREGLFHRGIGVIPLTLGPAQAESKFGRATGLRFATGAQLDLGPRWALRLPLVLAAADGTHGGYAEIDVAPSIVYRFRSRADQVFVPYLGGGVKLGAFGADRTFLGKPRLSTLDVNTGELLDYQHHHHGWSDPNFDTVAKPGGEAFLGCSLHAGRLFSMNLDVTGEVLSIDGVLVNVVVETVGVGFTF